MWFKSIARPAADSLWRDRDFMRLFLGSTLATLGSTVSQMALPLTAAHELGAGATEMGLLAAAELAPFALFSLPAGVWVDRVSRKWLAVGFDLCGALALALIPLAALGGWLSMTLLYLVGFAIGAVFAVGGTASQVYLTQLVGRSRLVEANSVLSGAGSVAGIVGPALAAVLVGTLGAPLAISLDALGFLLSACLIAGIGHDGRPPVSAGASMWVELREGLTLVWRHPLLRRMAVAAALWILLFDSFRALYVLFATRNLGLGANGLAVVNTLGALGALLGATAAHPMEARYGARNVMLVGFFASGLGMLGFAVLPGSGPTEWLAGLAMLAIDAGATLYAITYISLRQHVTPDALLGRMTATMRFLSVSTAPIGSAGAGRMGDLVGLRTTMVGVGMLGLILSALAARALPKIARQPASVPSAAAAVVRDAA